jgi:hypothetical protein
MGNTNVYPGDALDGVYVKISIMALLWSAAILLAIIESHLTIAKTIQVNFCSKE